MPPLWEADLLSRSSLCRYAIRAGSQLDTPVVLSTLGTPDGCMISPGSLE